MHCVFAPSLNMVACASPVKQTGHLKVPPMPSKLCSIRWHSSLAGESNIWLHSLHSWLMPSSANRRQTRMRRLDQPKHGNRNMWHQFGILTQHSGQMSDIHKKQAAETQMDTKYASKPKTWIIIKKNNHFTLYWNKVRLF